jgi:hypothetical protein
MRASGFALAGPTPNLSQKTFVSTLESPGFRGLLLRPEIELQISLCTWVRQGRLDSTGAISSHEFVTIVRKSLGDL